MQLNRRQCLQLAAAGAARTTAAAEATEGITLCAFSKHFQWADVAEMAAVCASLGYEGIDLTVRNDGHIKPEAVEEQLPRAVEIIQSHGLSVPMVTTAIAHAQSAHAGSILKTLQRLGIRRYRSGGFRYDDRRPLPEQIEEFRGRLVELAGMNREYNVCAMYHTHSGPGRVGASMWDLHLLLRETSPAELAVNFDIGHATIEGGYGGWMHSARLLLPAARGTAVKDFCWRRNPDGKWTPHWRPLGEGMVDFGAFFALLKASQFDGPLQLHMEYPELGGAATGKSETGIPRDLMIQRMHSDIERLRGHFEASGIATRTRPRA
jgi:sugar phosphate isomerase/epimerase